MQAACGTDLALINQYFVMALTMKRNGTTGKAQNLRTWGLWGSSPGRTTLTSARRNYQPTGKENTKETALERADF